MPVFVTLHGFPDFLFRLVMAFVIGGAIGYERELHARPAGLRTHILVCLGACLIAMVDARTVGVDGKIAAQIVTGVGFLGAGTILRGDRGTAVQGLTTAASLWCVAGMGIALGYGGMNLWLAVAAALIVMFTLTLVEGLERMARRRRRERQLIVYLKSPDDGSAQTATSRVLDILTKIDVKIYSVETDLADSNPLNKIVRLHLMLPENTDCDGVAGAIGDDPQIKQFVWEN